MTIYQYSLANDPFIVGPCRDRSALAEFHEAVLRSTIAVFLASGTASFSGRTRLDAAAHAAAHAIYRKAMGCKVTRVEVRRVSPPHMWTKENAVFWGGLVSPVQRWAFCVPSDLQSDLAIVRQTVSGWVGEALLRGNDLAPGSSLEEIVLARMLCDRAARSISADPGKIFDEQVAIVRGILSAHGIAHRALTRALLRRRAVHGPQLASLLAPVKRILAVPPEAVADDEW